MLVTCHWEKIRCRPPDPVVQDPARSVDTSKLRVTNTPRVLDKPLDTRSGGARVHI